MDIDEMLRQVEEQTRPPQRAIELAGRLAEGATRRRGRWRPRTAVLGAGFVAILLAGGGTAFAAEAGLLPWLDWTPDQQTIHAIELTDGSHWVCPVAMRIVAADRDDHSSRTEAQVEQVRDHFASLDLDRIAPDPEHLVEAQDRAERRPAEFTQSPADVEMAAWSATVSDLLYRYASEQGFDQVAIEAAGEHCEAAE